MKRVYCLYRVSSVKQVDYSVNNSLHDSTGDIPLQKQACRDFAARNDWSIIEEFSELGVSGFKVSAKNRDVIQDIRKAAVEKKFDVLLVFMFDRIGRIDSETPFVVEWFIKHGVEVWSVNEGQQCLDSHTDKLLNYIRYWQASGESIKTSVRTKAGIAQVAKDGLYHGGRIPLGYQLIKQGRTNKKGYEIHDIEINITEAEAVKKVYQKYVYEGFGILRLCRYLEDNGIRKSNGQRITTTALHGMLQNRLYLGEMICGGIHASTIDRLRILDNELYNQAQKIRIERAAVKEAQKEESQKTRSIPLNTKGESLLAGNIFCADCGSRLTLSVGGNPYTLKDGTVVEYRQVRYVCNGKMRKLHECDNQSTYSMKRLDGMVEELLLNLFKKVKSIPEANLIQKSYQVELASCRTKLQSARIELRNQTENLSALQSEVVDAIKGKSKFSPEILNTSIQQTQKAIAVETERVNNYESELDNHKKRLESIKTDYQRLVDWSGTFQQSSHETRKMITAYLIKSINVSRGYELDIAFNVSFQQFFNGI
ncbi:MAG: recombinase family protein [Eubacterium sp.]|nr:recombinase family protein [Eubacterium sp.]